MSRMAKFAIGSDKKNDAGEEVDEDGKVIRQMTAAQIRAAETVLRKILPDLSSVQELPVDDFEGMSRDEMLELLGSMVSNNKRLLENPDIRSAVNNSQTVIELNPEAQKPNDDS